MKALVTGANGFLGSWLVDRLLQEGYEVSVLIRQKNNAEHHLQALIAEFYLRRLIHQSIGVNNKAYRKLTIFIDLILYHRAMNNLGYVNGLDFTVAKNDLEKEIVKYFDKKQKPILALFMGDQTQLLNSISKKEIVKTPLTTLAKKFLEIDNVKAQMLGSIEIVWSQLLMRNQQNQIESMATDAIIDLSVNTAAAISGIASLMHVALTSTAASTGLVAKVLGTAANSVMALSLEAAIGCGVGMTAKFTVGSLDTSFLETSRALYSSFVNKTSFACELGQVSNKLSTSPSKEIIIPDTHKAGSSATGYLIACASGAVIRVFPNSLGHVVNGLAAISLAHISRNLANEAYTIITEVPNLYKLTQAKANSKNAQEVTALNEKIEESQAKILLYLLAMGDSSILAMRNAFFLYLHKGEIFHAVKSAQTFLGGLQSATTATQMAAVARPPTPNLQTLQFVVDNVK